MTLPELLREADPISFEPRRSVQGRLRARQRILAAPRMDAKPPQRRVLIAAVVFAMIGVTTGFAYWSRLVVNAAPIDFEMRLAEREPANGLRAVIVAGTNDTIFLHEDAVVTNSDIAKAEIIQGVDSTFSIEITFNTDGAAKMLRASRNHLGKPLAILVDGRVVAVPTIRSPVSRSANINGNFTRIEAEKIASGILAR